MTINNIGWQLNNIGFSALKQSKAMKRVKAEMRNAKREELREEAKQREREIEQQKHLQPLPQDVSKNIGLLSNNLSPKANEVASCVAFNIRKEKIEYGYIIDELGEITQSEKGNETSVLMSSTNKKVNNSCVFIHNHPNGVSFSFQDIEYALGHQNPKEIIASTDKGLYLMDISKNSNDPGIQEAIKRAKIKYNKLRSNLRKQFKERDANRILWGTLDNEWKLMARTFNWKYEFKEWH